MGISSSYEGDKSTHADHSLPTNFCNTLEGFLVRKVGYPYIKPIYLVTAVFAGECRIIKFVIYIYFPDPFLEDKS